MQLEKDEFEAWREHPVTQWFFDEVLKHLEDEAKEKFIEYAWGRKEIDPIYHAAIYERSECFRQLREAKFEEFEAYT